jgi:hypothetical protein
VIDRSGSGRWLALGLALLVAPTPALLVRTGCHGWSPGCWIPVISIAIGLVVVFACILATRAGSVWRTPDDTLVIEVGRVLYVVALLLLLPRVILEGTMEDVVVAIGVWGSAAAVSIRRATLRLPRAVVRRRRVLPRLLDAVVSGLGRYPMAYGIRPAVPWYPLPQCRR